MAYEIPEESRPRGRISNRPIPDVLDDQAANPVIPSAALQEYTDQTVQSNELMSSPTNVGTTAAGQQTVQAPSNITATTGTGTTIAAPTTIQPTSVTAATAGTPQTVTGVSGSGLTQQVTGQTRGTVTGTAAGASQTAGTAQGVITAAAQGQVSSGALANAITGQSATVQAQTATLPNDIQAAVGTNPASVTATVVNQPTSVVAQIASLPADTLVSGQLETLLNGIDSGTIPTWARAAVEAVDANLASRGMSRSSIGREALVNSIIQSAIPIAQANATQLQQVAMANLNNQQQAEVLTKQQQFQAQLTGAEFQQQAAITTAAGATLIGYAAGDAITSGNNNTAIGRHALGTEDTNAEK